MSDGENAPIASLRWENQSQKRVLIGLRGKSGILNPKSSSPRSPSEETRHYDADTSPWRGGGKKLSDGENAPIATPRWAFPSWKGVY